MSSVTIEKNQDVSTNLELTNTYSKERDLKHAVYETFHIDSGLDFNARIVNQPIELY